MHRTRRLSEMFFIAILMSPLCLYAVNRADGPRAGVGSTQIMSPIVGHCIPNVGEFTFVDGRLAIKITEEDDKPVRPHTELVANPPIAEEAEQLTHRGLVRFKAHLESSGGRVVVHWETVHNVVSEQSR